MDGDGEGPRGRADVVRFSPPGLKDARWIIGVLLLVAGTVGTLKVIAHFDNTVAVWSARKALVPGQQLARSDLVRTDVRFDAAARKYLSEPDPAGVVQRPIAAGDLVPRSAVTTAGALGVRVVSVPMEKGQADVVRPGADVEVWVADKVSATGTAEFAKPRLLIDRALVSHVGTRSSGVVAVAENQPVEIVVPRQYLAETIDAVNSGARITLVPLAGVGS